MTELAENFTSGNLVMICACLKTSRAPQTELFKKWKCFLPVFLWNLSANGTDAFIVKSILVSSNL